MAEKVYTPEERSRDAVKAVMGTRHGRRMIFEILDRCGIMRTSFNPDPMMLSFNEGQRNVGLSIYNDIDTHCPDLYLTMIKEAKEDYQYDRDNRNDDDDEHRDN